MPTFNSEQTFRDVRGQRLVTVKVSAGTLQVFAQHGDDVNDFVLDTEIDTDGVYTVDFDGPPVRMVPSGGCTFAFKTR
jgi:hypothetical protein